MGITEERIKRITEQAAAMKKIGKMSLDVSGELDALVSDNAAMEAEIQGLNEANDSLRERLNRGENHEAYMKLPLDAGGKPIRIGDVLYLPDSPGSIVVSGYERSTCSDEVYCIGYQDGRKSHFCPKLWTHKQPGPADSWEKLEEDANLGCRDYCEKHRLEECDYNMRVHLLARAKKLAGIEGEAQR